MQLTIRPETSADVMAIETLTRAAFLSAPHTSHTEQYIVNALRRSGQLALSLVADGDGELLGHVAISPVTISDGTAAWFGLGPISVEPKCQRQGIGSSLMREAVKIMRGRGAGGCVVLGDPAYYGRFGFRADSRLVLPGVLPQNFQALSFGVSKPQGTVAYHESFNAQA